MPSIVLELGAPTLGRSALCGVWLGDTPELGVGERHAKGC